MSMTSAEPLPAAKLWGCYSCVCVIGGVLRVEDGGVGDVKSRGVKFFEDNLCHPFPVGWSIPCGLCDEYWVVSGIDVHNVLQCMTDEWSYWIKVLDLAVVNTGRVNTERKHVPRPSFKGFPTSIASL
jgi:hypothetical protein